MPDESHLLSEGELRRLFGPIRSILNRLSVQDIRNTAAAAGFDVSRIPSESERRAGMGSRAEVMPAIDQLFGEMGAEDKLRTLRVLAEELARAESVRDELRSLLGRHGYEFINGEFVPVGLLDAREAPFLPQPAASDLARAAARVVSGDLGGAITSACGAVESTVNELYVRHGIGDPAGVAFQAKVNTAANRLRVFEEMHDQLVASGMDATQAHELVEHEKRETSEAAHALQVLRRNMGDVHGSRPVLKAAVYRALKQAQSICALFEGK